MNLEESLCRAFCDGITVSKVPSGFAVSTGFEDTTGDRVGFYLTHDASTGLYRIEDDGELVPSLLASGANVLKGSRARLFQQILSQGLVEYDENTGELHTAYLAESEIPSAAMRFVTLQLRIANLTTMRQEIVSANFRDDAIARIKSDLGQQFEIQEGKPLSDALEEFEPDVTLLAPDKLPVAVFIAVSDQRIYEALLMQMAADHEAQLPCSVVALIDREGSKLTSRKMRQRAHNRLRAVPEFYGQEQGAVLRIAMEADRRQMLAH